MYSSAAADARAAGTTALALPQSSSSPPHKPIDETTWVYIARVPFARLARGQGEPVAPLGELVAAIETDAYLVAQHGPEAIAALLRPVASPLLHVAPSGSGSSFGGGRALVWVSLPEFRDRCCTGDGGSSSSSKRKRPAPASSILGRLGMRREDLARLLKRVSSDYRAEAKEAEAAAEAKEAAQARKAVAAADARVEGVLAGFGGKGDELTRLMVEMEGQLEEREAARREVAMQAALEARMAVDVSEELAKARLGVWCLWVGGWVALAFVFCRAGDACGHWDSTTTGPSHGPKLTHHHPPLDSHNSPALASGEGGGGLNPQQGGEHGHRGPSVQRGHVPPPPPHLPPGHVAQRRGGYVG